MGPQTDDRDLETIAPADVAVLDVGAILGAPTPTIPRVQLLGVPVDSPVAHQTPEARTALAWLAVEGVAGTLVRSAETVKAADSGPTRKRWVVANLLKYARHAEAIFNLVPDSFQPVVEWAVEELVERIFREQDAGGHVNRERA